jgi:hypothetical protein
MKLFNIIIFSLATITNAISAFQKFHDGNNLWGTDKILLAVIFLLFLFKEVTE